MKQKHFIDSHKGATGLFVLALMFYFDRWQNTTAWVYLAVHGSYGLFWITKSRLFGDKSWEKPTGVLYGLVIWFGLTLYWIAPWLIIRYDVASPPWYLGLCIFLYACGVFYHFASDMQKHISLALRPGLIQSGLWARCRNPNYFGEFLIYGSFVLLPLLDGDGWTPFGWVPAIVLGIFLCAVWIPNMLRKDKSLSRYPEFAAYRRRSGIFIPYLL